MYPCHAGTLLVPINAEGRCSVIENLPKYPLSSVDHALELVLLLKRRGKVGVSDAARALGVAKSTAHRLLAMLAYHGFAVQEPSRLYRVGREIMPDHELALHPDVQHVLRPVLEELAHQSGETANAQILLGAHAKIIDCVPGTEVLCVGDRRGVTLPAESASGGLALLSLLSREEVSGIYMDNREVHLPRLFATLSRVRRQGFALNLGNTERHIRAIGVPVRDANGVGVVALVASVPAVRFNPTIRNRLIELLTDLALAAQERLTRLPQYDAS